MKPLTTQSYPSRSAARPEYRAPARHPATSSPENLTSQEQVEPFLPQALQSSLELSPTPEVPGWFALANSHTGGVICQAPEQLLDRANRLSRNGTTVIAQDAHVRVVHPDLHGGARMLRRGYNFVDGTDALGGLDAGLFFLAYVRDPDTHFIPIQSAMARHDALMEYLKVTGSGLFAVPPGAGDDGFVGQSLFA